MRRFFASSFVRVRRRVFFPLGLDEASRGGGRRGVVGLNVKEAVRGARQKAGDYELCGSLPALQPAKVSLSFNKESLGESRAID